MRFVPGVVIASWKLYRPTQHLGPTTFGRSKPIGVVYFKSFMKYDTEGVCMYYRATVSEMCLGVLLVTSVIYWHVFIVLEQIKWMDGWIRLPILLILACRRLLETICSAQRPTDCNMVMIMMNKHTICCHYHAGKNIVLSCVLFAYFCTSVVSIHY